MTPEQRAKHAAYMRAYLADPERRARNNARKREHYHRNRERILEREREHYRQNRDQIVEGRRPGRPRRHQWTAEEILDAIRELAVDGYAACPRAGGSLHGVARNRFGSWDAACEAAGVKSARHRPLNPNPKYSTVHSRLKSQRGTPPHCEECGATGPGRKYEWALKDGLNGMPFNELGHPYSANLDDYRRLCKACHSRQDRNGSRAKKRSA